MKSSDTPDEPSKISEFVEDTKGIIGLQPKMDFTTAHVFGSKPKIESMDFDDILERSNPEGILGNVGSISAQDILIWSPSELTSIRSKENYVEFQQRYTDILNEVKHEAEQARSLDSDIEKIKNEAYDEFDVVMEEIYNAGVSMPEVTWNEDGSLDIGWPLKTGGSSTILVYGDNHAICNIYLGTDDYVRSVCKIRDSVILPKLIEILSSITT